MYTPEISTYQNNQNFDRTRLSLLGQNGYPNPMSLSTAFPEFYPEVFKNNNGYWAYVRQKHVVPWAKDILYLAGDPICTAANRDRFIYEAVQQLSGVGKIAALQVHAPIALSLKKAFTSSSQIHQFGLETQVKLPYALTGPVGTKIRHCVNAGLFVQELKYDQRDASGNTETIFLPISLEKKTVRYSMSPISTDTYLTELSMNQYRLIADGDTCAALLCAIESVQFADATLRFDEYKRKLRRFLEGKLPPSTILFAAIEQQSEIGVPSSFGYFQTTPTGYNKHLLSVHKGTSVEQKLLLVPGIEMISEQDRIEMRQISDTWLLRKKNKKEMGPPLLKPYREWYEPGRRLFVARDRSNAIIAFVDFDPVNWIDTDGSLQLDRIGYYTDMVRTDELKNMAETGKYKNVRFLIIGAAMQRFAKEGKSHVNLGLNPLAEISDRHSLSSRKDGQTLTPIERFLQIIYNNDLFNQVTFNYKNLYFTKQKNWVRCHNVPTYMVFVGTELQNWISLFHGFLATGTLCMSTLPNFFRSVFKSALTKNKKHSKEK